MKDLLDKTLLWGSRRVGIDLDYFVKGSFWTGIPTFLEAGLNILVAVIFANLVPIEVYGEYNFFKSVFGMFALFSLPGIGTALIQSVARKYYRSLIDAANLILKVSILGSIAFALSAGYFYFTGREHMVIYFLITAALFPFYNPFRMYISFLMGKENYQELSKFQVVHTLFTNIFIIAAIVLTRNITIIVTTFLVAGNLISYILYKIVKKKYSKQIEKSKKDKELTKYGIHLTLMEVLPTISNNIDKVLLTYFLGFKAIALYGVAQSLASRNKLFFKPVLKILLPKLSKQKDARKTYLLLRSKIPLILGFSGILCVAFILIIPFVIGILFPDTYNDSILFAQVLLAGQLFVLVNMIFQNFLTSQKYTKGLYKATIYPAVFRIIILFILLPIYGIWGAIASDLLTKGYLFGLYWFTSAKESGAE